MKGSNEIGLNINGDVCEETLIDRAKLCNKLYIPIWIGELDTLNPFRTAELLAEYTQTEIIIFCSPSRRSCAEIKSEFERLKKKFDNDFLLALVMGKSKKISTLVHCLRRLKEKLGKVFAGCNGIKLFNAVSNIADGFVFNYRTIFKTYKFKACYAPSLILPSKLDDKLILAARALLGELDFGEIWYKTATDGDLSLLYYTVSGSIGEVAYKVVQALKLYDHVILGVPFFRDEESVKRLPDLLKIVRSSGRK